MIFTYVVLCSVTVVEQMQMLIEKSWQGIYQRLEARNDEGNKKKHIKFALTGGIVFVRNICVCQHHHWDGHDWLGMDPLQVGNRQDRLKRSI